ncbi:ABC transporter ATP-binding protein [Marinitoga sp. 38H-ov]|uniref:ABC transporter ATP-binding protein n=1 Tax=Marinitoga sp. 38H-ov TaxID=1755814 RepID=UPI0013EBF536|nr:ABC transporter ATP-binding protein [Marinitoga sp. 38H-ov]
MIKVENLVKIYENKKKALDNINFEINKGEIIGLVGRNGAGKTTLMKCMLGLLKFQNGNIYIKGYNIKDSFEKINKKIGFLLRPAFYDHLNAYENLKIVNILLGKKNNKIIDEVLNFVGLYDVRYKKVRSYSFGMKQRLGIARTLIVEPEILILDEPLVGLDPVGAIEMKNKIRQFAKEEGKTVLFSSHLLNDVEELCDKVVMLENGKIIANDTLENIKNRKKYILKIKGKVNLDIGSDVKVFYKNDRTYVIIQNKKDIDKILYNIYKNNYKIEDIEVESFKLSKLFEGVENYE